MQIVFDSELSKAFATRSGEPAVQQKMLRQYVKTFTPQQKVRYAAATSLPVQQLKTLIAQRLKKADASIRTSAASAVKSLKSKEALAVFLIDLEYSNGHIVGTMPTKPLKVGSVDKLFGKSLKVGSPDGPVREGICIGAVTPKKVQINLMIAGEKAPVPVALDQIIAIGDAKVEATWTKETTETDHTKLSANMGAAKIPASK